MKHPILPLLLALSATQFAQAAEIGSEEFAEALENKANGEYIVTDRVEDINLTLTDGAFDVRLPGYEFRKFFVVSDRNEKATFKELKGSGSTY